MFKKLLNELRLELAIRPMTPLLIKSSQESGANPLLPQMSFVRSPHPKSGEQTAYIPGSSLKGVIRSRAEQYIRTLHLNIHEFNDFSVHKKVAEALKRQNFYQVVCSVTRMFGSTSLAGRIRFPDFYPDQALEVLPTRQMVAIDRRSGASANTFTMEVVPPIVDRVPVVFRGALQLQNFERWQVGLLAMVIRDLNSGALTVGFGSSRGLGHVQVSYTRMTLTYPGMLDKYGHPQVESHILGLGQLASREDVELYGFHQMQDPPPSYTLRDEHIVSDFGRIVFDTGTPDISEEEMHYTIEEMLKPLVNDWADYVDWQTRREAERESR